LGQTAKALQDAQGKVFIVLVSYIMSVELLIIENHLSPNPSPNRRGVPKAGRGKDAIMGN
jgi:hypothetical protein